MKFSGIDIDIWIQYYKLSYENKDWFNGEQYCKLLLWSITTEMCFYWGNYFESFTLVSLITYVSNDIIQ